MNNAAAVKAAYYLSLVLAGLFAGFLLGVLVLELSLRRFDGAVYAQVRQVELASLDDLATALLIPALLVTAFLVVVAARARGRGLWLTLTALGLLVLVFVTSLLFNVPINTDQLTWDVQAPPADWAGDRDLWQVAHAVRTVAAILAFGILSAAMGSFRMARNDTGAVAGSGRGGTRTVSATN